MWKINLFVLAFIAACSLQHAEAEKVKVSIYYESLCPHSISFIVKQLHPAYNKIGDYLDVDFVPYGKADQQFDEEDQKWSFRCQHGAAECYGNKLQVCGLSQTDVQKQNVDFVNCAMAASNPASNAEVQKCAEDFKYNWDNIRSCANSRRGDDMLADYGDRTHAVTPKITFVPTIIFNDKYDEDLQNGAQNNFLKTACGLMKEKPDVCG